MHWLENCKLNRIAFSWKQTIVSSLFLGNCLLFWNIILLWLHSCFWQSIQNECKQDRIYILFLNHYYCEKVIMVILQIHFPAILLLWLHSYFEQSIQNECKHDIIVILLSESVVLHWEWVIVMVLPIHVAAIMRCTSMMQENLVPLVGVILKSLTDKLLLVAKVIGEILRT